MFFFYLAVIRIMLWQKAISFISSPALYLSPFSLFWCISPTLFISHSLTHIHTRHPICPFMLANSQTLSNALQKANSFQFIASLDLIDWSVSMDFWRLWCINLFGQFLIDDWALWCKQCLTIAFTAAMHQQWYDACAQRQCDQHAQQNQ